MTPLDAVSVAIRERLLAGRPAPLPGLGTLVRHHVAARVEERPDGSRVLLPPGDTIGLAPTGTGEDSLAEAFGRLRGLAPESAAAAYRSAMDQIEARLAVTGEVRLPGVGMLRRTSGGVVLGVEADLLAAVNRTYEGLAPVGAGPAEPATTRPSPIPPPPAPPPPSADADRQPPAAAEPADPFGAVLDPPSGAGPRDAPDPTAPIRDLSTGFGTPAAPPAPNPFRPEPDAPGPSWPDSMEPAPAPPMPSVPPAHEGVAPPSPAEPVASPSSPAAEVSVPTALSPNEPPAPPYAAPEPLPPFVDESTLDADLDEMLAVPFGEADGPEIQDVIPPTPPDRQPVDSAAPSDADWASRTWTAPSLADAPPLPSEADLAYESVPDPEIEDADFDVVGAAPAHEPERAAPQAPAPVLVERVGPEAELEAYLSVPGESPAPQGPPSPLDAFASAPVAAPPAPEDAGDAAEPKRFPWWLVLVLILLAIAAAALVWYWPQVMALQQGGPTQTVEAAPVAPTAGTSTASLTDTGDSLVAEVEPPPAETSPMTPTATTVPAQGALVSSRTERTASGGGTPAADAPASTRPGLGLAPAPGIAILPPRLAGLPDADARALSGREPVDDAADAWTLVVLSTPSREDASALVGRYRRAGYRTGALTASGGRTYRVAVGQFATRDDAIRLRDRLPPEAPDDTWPLSLRTL